MTKKLFFACLIAFCLVAPASAGSKTVISLNGGIYLDSGSFQLYLGDGDIHYRSGSIDYRSNRYRGHRHDRHYYRRHRDCDYQFSHYEERWDRVRRCWVDEPVYIKRCY